MTNRDEPLPTVPEAFENLEEAIRKACLLVEDVQRGADVAAGMHNAAATTLLNVVSLWAGMRGDFGAVSPSAKDRELATPANGEAKAEERVLAD